MYPGCLLGVCGVYDKSVSDVSCLLMTLLPVCWIYVVCVWVCLVCWVSFVMSVECLLGVCWVCVWSVC